jgi:hypothetical protein
MIETPRGNLGDNITALINERGSMAPLGEWAHVHVSWYTHHPECWRDEAIVKRIQSDFDPGFRPVVVKHVWRRPNGGHEPFYYHVLARRIVGDVHTKLGDPLKFENQADEEYQGDIYEWHTLSEEPLIKDGRPPVFVPFDARTYALVRDTVHDYEKQSAKQAFLARVAEEQERKAAMVAAIDAEMRYRIDHDEPWLRRAITNATVGWEDMRVMFQPSKVMPGTELRPSGLVVVKD